MHYFKLVIRNAMRHRLRTGLTVLGITIAILAFGLLRTVVDAWYSGADAASATRLVTRNSVSLAFALPLTYMGKIKQVSGVAQVSHANWFGGIYVSQKNFFPQFAIQASTYFNLYPEFVVEPEQMRDFLRNRKGAIVGRKTATAFGLKVGDQVTLRGTIFPGNWEFVIAAIYDGTDKKTDTTQFFFHWDYLNETLRKSSPRRANSVGVYVIGVESAERAAEVAAAVDSTFRNSLAETRTETEQAFQLGFVSMTEQIVAIIEIVALLVIFIIMAVMANTMAMTARERMAEYAVLKTLGFESRHLALIIVGESLTIAFVGASVGIVLTFPTADWFGNAMGSLFKVFAVSNTTVYAQIGAALVVGCVASIFPCLRASRLRIADGLRSVG